MSQSLYLVLIINFLLLQTGISLPTSNGVTLLTSTTSSYSSISVAVRSTSISISSPQTEAGTSFSVSTTTSTTSSGFPPNSALSSSTTDLTPTTLATSSSAFQPTSASSTTAFISTSGEGPSSSTTPLTSQSSLGSTPSGTSLSLTLGTNTTSASTTRSSLPSAPTPTSCTGYTHPFACNITVDPYCLDSNGAQVNGNDEGICSPGVCNSLTSCTPFNGTARYCDHSTELYYLLSYLSNLPLGSCEELTNGSCLTDSDCEDPIQFPTFDPQNPYAGTYPTGAGSCVYDSYAGNPPVIPGGCQYPAEPQMYFNCSESCTAWEQNHNASSVNTCTSNAYADGALCLACLEKNHVGMYQSPAYEVNQAQMLLLDVCTKLYCIDPATGTRLNDCAKTVPCMANSFTSPCNLTDSNHNSNCILLFGDEDETPSAEAGVCEPIEGSRAYCFSQTTGNLLSLNDTSALGVCQPLSYGDYECVVSADCDYLHPITPVDTSTWVVHFQLIRCIISSVDAYRTRGVCDRDDAPGDFDCSSKGCTDWGRFVPTDTVKDCTGDSYANGMECKECLASGYTVAESLNTGLTALYNSCTTKFCVDPTTGVKITTGDCAPAVVTTTTEPSPPIITTMPPPNQVSSSQPIETGLTSAPQGGGASGGEHSGGGLSETLTTNTGAGAGVSVITSAPPTGPTQVTGVSVITTNSQTVIVQGTSVIGMAPPEGSVTTASLPGGGVVVVSGTSVVGSAPSTTIPVSFATTNGETVIVASGTTLGLIPTTVLTTTLPGGETVVISGTSVAGLPPPTPLSVSFVTTDGQTVIVESGTTLGVAPTTALTTVLDGQTVVISGASIEALPAPTDIPISFVTIDGETVIVESGSTLGVLPTGVVTTTLPVGETVIINGTSISVIGSNATTAAGSVATVIETTSVTVTATVTVSASAGYRLKSDVVSVGLTVLVVVYFL